MNSILTSPRHFNDIRDCGPYLIKSSIHFQKISAEINFYENISDDLKRFYPQYLGKTKDGKWPAGYKIEKIPNYDLGVYFTQKNKGGDYSFEDIFTLLEDYFGAVKKQEVSKEKFFNCLDTNVLKRNLERCKALRSTAFFEDVDHIFKSAGFIDIFDYSRILNDEIRASFEESEHFELWLSHGDLCFSNIIVNNGKIYLVDPRGYGNPLEEPYLIPEYDLAKLSQCIYGGYDFINHCIEENSQFDLKDRFLKFLLHQGIEYKRMRLIEASHFLSMLQLHTDSRSKVLRFAKRSIEILKGLK